MVTAMSNARRTKVTERAEEDSEEQCLLEMWLDTDELIDAVHLLAVFFFLYCFSIGRLVYVVVHRTYCEGFANKQRYNAPNSWVSMPPLLNYWVNYSHLIEILKNIVVVRIL